MTVSSIAFHTSYLFPSPGVSKQGLLPTPTGLAPAVSAAEPEEDSLADRGVVCVDRALVKMGPLAMLVPKLIRVRREMIKGRVKNSFLEFEPLNGVGDEKNFKKRRMSCPDLSIVTPRNSAKKTGSGITTYMIRNIPTRFTSLSFVRLLDEYGFAGTFNFFYLPMDFRSGKNMGYAFINFLEPETGLRFVDKFHARRLPVTTSKKVMEISASRRQGLLDNISLFRTSDLLNSASLPHYKPLIATPETGGVLVPLTEHNFPSVVSQE